jgi:mono/diheme cytochrome c family protein
MTTKLVAVACLLVTTLWSGRASEGGIFVLAQAQGTTPASQAGDPARIDGDVARGQALFESKGACLGCHRVGARGSRFGPDLSDIGARAGSASFGRGGPGAPAGAGDPGRGDAPDPAAPGRARAELARALLDPGADILPSNRTVRLLTRGGESITARVLNQDTFSLQLIDTKERLFSIPKSELREFVWIKSSSMPSYRDKLTPQELADLIAYLVSLKGLNK